jgi:S1-C subfamily serine protease
MRRVLHFFMAAFVAVGLQACVSSPAFAAPAEVTVVEQSYKAAVAVVRADGGHGSGVVVRPGQIITAAHVVVGQEEVLIVFADKSSAKGIVLWTDTKNDTALVAVAPSTTKAFAPLRCGAPLRVGEDIYTIGHPGALTWIATFGRVSGTVEHYVITQLAVWFGNSGGGVYDSQGQVVGIAVGLVIEDIQGSMGDKSITGLSAIIPATTICKLIEANSK